MFILGVSGSPDLSLNDNGQVFGPARCCYIMVIVKEMCGGVVDAAEFFVIFVWVPACRRALPGDRIAVDTAETGEHQPPRAGRISSKSGVSGSGGICSDFTYPCRRTERCVIMWGVSSKLY